jgi:hypothetical protein
MAWVTGKDASIKTRQQVILKPSLPCGTPLACRKHDKSSPQLADRYNAQVQRVFVLCVYPISYACVGTSANQFRRDVGIEEKTIHDRSTGRPVDGLRPKSRSSAMPLTASNTSRRLLPGCAWSGSGGQDWSGGGGQDWSACKMTSSASLNAPLRRRWLMSASTSGLVI